MDSSFQLTPFEHDRIYEKIIEPTSFDDTVAVEKPTIVIVGAQTGRWKKQIGRTVNQGIRRCDSCNGQH